MYMWHSTCDVHVTYSSTCDICSTCDEVLHEIKIKHLEIFSFFFKSTCHINLQVSEREFSTGLSGVLLKRLFLS